jgi:hypothetical protein
VTMLSLHFRDTISTPKGPAIGTLTTSWSPSQSVKATATLELPAVRPGSSDPELRERTVMMPTAPQAAALDALRGALERSNGVTDLRVTSSAQGATYAWKIGGETQSAGVSVPSTILQLVDAARAVHRAVI